MIRTSSHKLCFDIAFYLYVMNVFSQDDVMLKSMKRGDKYVFHLLEMSDC